MKRESVFAIICFATLASGCLPSAAADWIDTTKLPRLSDAKELYASPSTTQFTVPISVPLAAEATSKLLAAAGWQQYGRPFSAQAQNPNMAIMEFKKGHEALSVFVNVAPAQGNATAVGYTAVALTNDLPFMKSATSIEFDHDRPYLKAVVPDTVDEVLAFYRKELATQGWLVWSLKDGANPSGEESAGAKTEKGAYAYYVRDAQRPFAQPPRLLVLQRGDDGRIKLELRTAPTDVLMAQSKQGHETPEFQAFDAARVAAQEKKAAADAQAKAEAEARSAQRKAESDKMDGEFNKLAQQMMRDAMADARKPPQAAAQAQNVQARNTQAQSAQDTELLGVLADNPASIPVPDTAEDVEFDAERGKLDFNSPSGVKALAAFYRASLKPLGWKERTSVINRSNMVVLNFSKSGKELSFTIMQMGQKVDVSATGSGLVTASAKPAEPARKAVAASSAANTNAAAALPQTEQAVEAGEEVAGFPVPKERSLSGTEKTPFRIVLNASVPANVVSVAAFYRRELLKRGWKEEPQGAMIKPDEATIAFTAPDGPALLRLERKNDETVVRLAVKNPAEATKAGVLPKAGQAKILFGNMITTEAVITINKQTVRVAAGAGAKKPDGPTIDLPPGKYKYAFKIGSKPAENDEVEVVAGDTWGLLIGPGGALALQVY